MIVFIAVISFLIVDPGEEIIIKDQWLRPSAEKMATALYFTIENKGDEPDTLYSIESDVSDNIEIHETYSSGDLMGMREIGSIIIEAGTEVLLEPGSKHIMVMKLKRDIKNGDEIDFILYFRKAGELSITAEAKRDS
jgi:copper(I)-binding protein